MLRKPRHRRGLRLVRCFKNGFHQTEQNLGHFSQGEDRVVDSPEAVFTRLTDIGIAHLHLSRVEVGLMVFGELLDLIDCWQLETGRAKPARIWFIDDIIPAGI